MTRLRGQTAGLPDGRFSCAFHGAPAGRGRTIPLMHDCAATRFGRRSGEQLPPADGRYEPVIAKKLLAQTDGL